MWNCTSPSTRSALETNHPEHVQRREEEQRWVESRRTWWAGGDLNSRPYGPQTRVSACKEDVLSGESTLLTRLNYRPKPRTRKPRSSRLRFRGSGKSRRIDDLSCLHRL